MRGSLREPGAKLLVYGPRRMGKTSLLEVALERLAAGGRRGFLADLSRASTVADIAYRIVDAASRAFGTSWKDVTRDLAGRLSGVATWTSDPATGVFVPRFEIALRRADVQDQRTTLGTVLDAIEATARARKAAIGIVLDEFQEITRFGGADAEWHLRGVVQHHHHVSYVFAGSEQHLIEQMLGPSRAFYQLVDVLAVGPIEPGHFAAWIDDRLAGAGVRARGVGARIVRLAGPRTRDVVRVARTCYHRCRGAGVAGLPDADRAFLDEVASDTDLLQAHWASLTPHRQDVLRAVAGATAGLTSAATRERFTLASSSAVAQTAAAFVADGWLVRADTPVGYDFDSPFARAWVVLNALPDVGLRPDPLARPAPGPSGVREPRRRPYARRARRTRRP